MVENYNNDPELSPATIQRHMMKLFVEITPSCSNVGVNALAELLGRLSDDLRSPPFTLLQGPPQTRTVLLSRYVVDRETSSILIGELVTAPHYPQEGDYGERNSG